MKEKDKNEDRKNEKIKKNDEINKQSLISESATDGAHVITCSSQ
jgi:hypothetical protein